MQVPDFILRQPATLQEAITAAQEASRPPDGSHAPSAPEQGYDWLGGGTDLLCNYKWRINQRPVVIALRGVAELQSDVAGSLAAGRTLWQLENDAEIQRRYPALASTAALVASPLIRRSATLGGNLHLDTRCWHFNQTAEWRAAHRSCLKAEADQCRVLPDPGDVCVAAYCGDLAPVLIAYGAVARLHGPDGERRVPLAEYFAGDGIRRFAERRRAELMVAVEMPADAEDWRVNYRKLRLRQTFDFPEGGVAVGLQWESGNPGVIAAARIATTAYASVPLLHPEVVELLQGQLLDQDLADRAGALLESLVQPMKNTSMSPSYRRKMARVLCRRALLDCSPHSSS